MKRDFMPAKASLRVLSTGLGGLPKPKHLVGYDEKPNRILTRE